MLVCSNLTLFWVNVIPLLGLFIYHLSSDIWWGNNFTVNLTNIWANTLFAIQLKACTLMNGYVSYLIIMLYTHVDKYLAKKKFILIYSGRSSSAYPDLTLCLILCLWGQGWEPLQLVSTCINGVLINSSRGYWRTIEDRCH